MQDLMQQVLRDYGPYMGVPQQGLSSLQQKYADGGMVQEEQPAVPATADEALAQAVATRQQINAAILRKLAEQEKAITGPSEQEKHWRLAQAFANPGKTGSFFEALGGASGVMADYRQQQREAQQAQRQMAIQNLQTRGELSQQNYELLRDAERRNMIQKYLLGDGTAGGVTQQGGAGVSGIPMEARKLLAAGDTDKAIDTIVKASIEYGKPTDLQKNLGQLVQAGYISNEQAAAIMKASIQPKFEMVDVVTPQGTLKLPAEQARTYYETGRLPGQPIAQQGTAIPTQEQLGARAEALKEQAKADIAAGQTLLDQKQFATQQISAAKQAGAIVQQFPNAVGLLAQPGIKNAVMTAISEGVSTPFGNFSLNIEEPLAKLKLSPEEIKARTDLLQPVTQLEVGFRKLFLKGEGAVSNMEGALAKYLGPSLSDNPQSFMTKAGAVQIAAEKAAAISDAFAAYKETNPEAGPRSFQQTPQYKAIVDAYENKYAQFMQANKIPFAAPAKPAGGGGSTLDLIRQERARRKGSK